MPVTNVTHDLDTRTIVISAEFAAPVERIWQVYADPRQLEQVFGPPTYPATFVEHDLSPGGKAHYFMTSPEGEKYYGWWKVTAVDEPRTFSFEDGFASDDSFAPLEDMPVSRNVYQFEAPTAGPGPRSPPPTTLPKRYRRCSTWASSKARRRPSTRSTPRRRSGPIQRSANQQPDAVDRPRPRQVLDQSPARRRIAGVEVKMHRKEINNNESDKPRQARGAAHDG